MFSLDCSSPKVTECFISSKDSMQTNDSTRLLELNLIYPCQRPSINGICLLFFFFSERSSFVSSRDGCFECAQVGHLKIAVQILLHSSPPVDMNRTGNIQTCTSPPNSSSSALDLLYVQHVKALGNRQTFHPNKLDYDVFNIEIDLGPIDLLLHGLFLKKLWWLKVRKHFSCQKISLLLFCRKTYSVGIKRSMIFMSRISSVRRRLSFTMIHSSI